MMSNIRSKNTSPELLIRRALHARGFRFRVHAKNLPGTPDLVLPKFNAVIFIHGCFWHGHDCRHFKIPQTRQAFWIEKIGKNRIRDKQQMDTLRAANWKVLVVWECAVRAMKKQKTPALIDLITCWFQQGSEFAQLTEADVKIELLKIE